MDKNKPVLGENGVTVCSYFQGEVKRLEERIKKLEGIVIDNDKLSLEEISKDVKEHSKNLSGEMGLK